ncbi:MAG: OprD family outer membrane porin [Flavobacteriales bacterium]|nr:OprD family outer membrane porin [Flavobacteriales bacterium]
MTLRVKPPWGTMRGVVFMLTLLGSTTLSRAQHDELDIPEKDSTVKETVLSDIMRKGKVEGRFRQYSMATINQGELTDLYAIAFGGSLGFGSERWKGFQFKLSGGYTFDLVTSDLTKPDPSTGQLSRYELGLFDVTDPRKRNDVAYLQLFQLNYARERTRIVFGRQELNTPFLNPQDGRMHPSLFEGVWGAHTTKKGTHLEVGWLYKASPRSTASWYGIAESMSLYPTGVNVFGKPNSYGPLLRSAGIFAANIDHHFAKRLKISAWDLYVENIFNTALLQADLGKKEQRWMLSGQAVRQDAVTNAGGLNDSAAYMPAGSSSWAFSGRFRMDHGRFRWQANYTRVTARGRYLMPREWGRDPFFTFLPRERNEGLGDLHAATLNLIWRDLLPGLRLQTDGGVYWLPAPTNARLNKYAMPSYTQFDVNAQYQFQGGWKGLVIQLLYLVKLPLEDVALTPKQTYNRVDMHHLDLIINYTF